LKLLIKKCKQITANITEYEINGEKAT